MSLVFSRFQREDGTGNLTLFHNGEMFVATSDHPNWNAIVDAIDESDASVVNLFDVSKAVEKKFKALSERVTVRGGRVHFDGDEVNNTLTKQIVRFVEDGEDFGPLVNFYERLALNPNQESVSQLYTWLDSHAFTITEKGQIVGYKGVEVDGNGGFRSVKSGEAVVNGEPFKGQIPNNIGDVVEMPRSEVTFNPDVTCSSGLHVGTFKYATDWGRNGAVLKVIVDPRDVVSVPSDHNGEKLRTCRYTVVEVIEQQVSTAVDYDNDDDYYDPFDDTYCCEWCDE